MQFVVETSVNRNLGLKQSIILKSELQAVIMAAGKGSRMMELTARRPKCLLPIGNFPMIWFPLQLLQKSGFQEVIIVVLEVNKSEILAALEKCGLKIKFELISIPLGEDWGTADSLRYLEEINKIKSDVLVLSCDLVTDVSLNPLLELYRKHNPTLTALFVPADHVTLPTPGPKSKNKPERDFVCIEDSTSRLLFVASASDFEEELPLPQKLMRKFPQQSLHSRHLDSHAYVIARWLCKYLLQNRSLSTIKGELLPHIVRKQMMEKPKKTEQDKAASIVAVDTKTDWNEMSEEGELVLKARSMSSYTDRRLEATYLGDSVRCYSGTAPSGTFLIRANSLADYVKANRMISEKWSDLTGGLERVAISPSATVHSSQLEEASCLVGEKTSVAEKTSLRGAILGCGSQVDTKTRLLDCIIMPGVRIGQGCALVNCIVCDDAEVSDGCDLKDCLIGSHFKVPPGAKHANEVLIDADRLMEI